MKIRNNQIEQMLQAGRQESNQSLIDEMRQIAPVATSHYNDAELLTVIEQATTKAGTYGITSSESTTTFVKLAIFAGPRFDEEPGVKRFLQSPDLSPDYKIVLLGELVAEHVRQNC